MHTSRITRFFFCGQISVDLMTKYALNNRLKIEYLRNLFFFFFQLKEHSKALCRHDGGFFLKFDFVLNLLLLFFFKFEREYTFSKSATFYFLSFLN